MGGMSHEAFYLTVLNKPCGLPQRKSSFQSWGLGPGSQWTRKSPCDTAGIWDQQPSLESFSTHLPLSPTSQGLYGFPREHAHIHGSYILVLTHTSGVLPHPLPGKQAGFFLSDRGGWDVQLAEAVQPRAALQGLSWRVLTLCLRLSNLSLLTPLAHPRLPSPRGPRNHLHEAYIPGHILMGTLWTGAQSHLLHLNPLFLGVMARAGTVTSPRSGKCIFVTVPRSFQGIFIPPFVNSTFLTLKESDL